MFPEGAAAIFLVNRPCIGRHHPAKTVIAGFADARHAKTVLALPDLPPSLPS
jgi:hypothetical protein